MTTENLTKANEEKQTARAADYALGEEFNTLALAVRTARASKGKAKKQFGKKSPEVKAARKATREAKKALEAFKTAHPEFAAAKLAPKAPKPHGAQLPPPKPPKAPDEVVATYDATKGDWVPKPGATFGEEAFAREAAEPVMMEAAVEVAGEPLPEAPAATVAPVPTQTKGLSARLVDILQAGNVVSPSQAAALVTAQADWGSTVTAKQAADALGRLAKTGKATKTGEGREVRYAAPAVQA